MAGLKLDGLGVALVTPFTPAGSIDYEALEVIINHVINGGVDYIVAMGTTAETPTLSREEKIILADYIKEKTDGRVPLVIGIGGNNTKRICDRLQSLNLDGYSAVLSVTPYYNKPTQEGLYQHYKTIAAASPLPIILYNVPGRTGVNLSAKTTLRLAEDIPNICAIKEASGKIDQCEEIINNCPERFSVISGDDAATFNIMSRGGKGVISVVANAFPREMKKLVELCSSPSREKASTCQASLQNIITPLFEDGNPAGVKAALAELGLIHNILRLPLVPVSEHVLKKIKKASKEIVQSLD